MKKFDDTKNIKTYKEEIIMIRKCISCGAALEDDEIFCGECGAKQVADVESEVKQEKNTKLENSTTAELDKDAFLQAKAEAKARLEFEREEKERKKAERKNNPKHFAIISLIMGILSYVGIFTIFGPFITVPLGLVFGFLGLKSEKKKTSIAGIGLNIGFIIVLVLILIFA